MKTTYSTDLHGFVTPVKIHKKYHVPKICMMCAYSTDPYADTDLMDILFDYKLKCLKTNEDIEDKGTCDEWAFNVLLTSDINDNMWEICKR